MNLRSSNQQHLVANFLRVKERWKKGKEKVERKGRELHFNKNDKDRDRKMVFYSYMTAIKNNMQSTFQSMMTTV